MTTLFSIAWLLLGGLLQLFSIGKWAVPLAAWLAPAFLLHFTRDVSTASGVLVVWLVLFISVSISHRGVIPLPGLAFFGVTALVAATIALPFLAAHLLAPILPGFWSTFVFPITWTAAEFLAARLNPYGTWGALGYTQHGNLPLMQLASVTGIAGIAFLMCWFAAVVNYAWDWQFNWSVVQQGVLLYAVVWSLVMLISGIRLAFAPKLPTVRIAGIGWPKGLIEPSEFMQLFTPGLSDAARQNIRRAFQPLHESFLERSRSEAQAGAKIIVWPEANLLLLKEDESPFIERAQRFAQENNVFLLMGMATISPGAPRPVENKALLLSPAGETVLSYIKITAVPGFEANTNVRGKGPIPIVETPYGRLASAICFDLDFSQIIRQIGRFGTDLMLVPASDWREITHLHQIMAEFRAIENGVAVFRITRWGGSGAVDPYGHRLASMDDFMAKDNVMVAQVPIAAGVTTIYARVGDLFAWLCVACLMGIIGWMLYTGFN